MPHPFLLSRVLLRFDSEESNLLNEVSAAAFTPDGSLWVGSDELASIERLTAVEPYVYGNHQPFAVSNFVKLANPDGEIDIEGLDYSDSYLWFTGSHSSKRKKAKGKKPDKDIQKLATIEVELNRYMIARIPVIDGELVQSASDPNHPEKTLTAAYLQTTETGNLLTDALKDDPHLGVYMSTQLASKDNGFDVEGLTVRGNRIFLGLRGPVLGGWAIILELEMNELEPGLLSLKRIGPDNRYYKKHFVNLNGLGIRELCLYQDDLIILAGPTMVLEGKMEIFKLKKAFNRDGDTIASADSGDLKSLFDLPFTIGSDHAEGLALFKCLGQSNALLVVYDAPDQARRIEPAAVLMDVFRLK
ncbi:DUF3616 domain-containing protein [Oculatella sp. LEGE 06141]|uniref:DUF3616 domain-containing protein n=1 Tax=Oculatella sp. LEGE 06141 TaxID=1828648 RepID=UPI001882C86D|nr:DUF3616 domain-containing protein [Oculatella sp. LEGE 06141]MBE9179941.1 DUF3616 domain-containing protein [Oculatella sp. LEGE 06141]